MTQAETIMTGIIHATVGIVVSSEHNHRHKETDDNDQQEYPQT